MRLEAHALLAIERARRNPTHRCSAACVWGSLLGARYATHRPLSITAAVCPGSLLARIPFMYMEAHPRGWFQSIRREGSAVAGALPLDGRRRERM